MNSRRLMAVGLAGVLVLALTGTAFAKAGGNGGGNHNGGATQAASTITLNQDSSTLAFGSDVTFTTNAVGLSGNQYPMVYLQCSQGSNVVYGQLDQPTATFVLGGASSPWYASPGPATCVGQLWAYGGNNGPQLLQSTASFGVGG